MTENNKSHFIGEKLQDLLERNFDAQEGFKQAMEDTHNHHLKRFFFAKAVQRGEFIAELEQRIKNLKEESKKEGTIAGTVHRAWIGFKTAFAGKNDEEVLEECIRGEKTILEEYEDGFKYVNFPPAVGEILRYQMREIQKTLDEIKSLEDLQERKWDADKDFASKV
ncbi:PA2169 family four-helix-bundle protein [Zunongwangia sp. F363]|uniref:PA2169 family four-helix-bundle protein n=1 Tax=Autumnicola tepida TaxID=3075595 RepID=A0ABU3C646_9FLAO|nr:PA2169 family four-helix-bundle protein [Zunongwangia sp. F363]MDT0641789.1 PA2169 family four-helix-bundle protein [Zunongwangia sp. F363]